MTNPRFTFWILLAAFLIAGGCGTPKRSSNPLAGWRISGVRDNAITGDYRSYIQSLPPDERKYIETHATHIEELEDGTGQHAVRIEMARYGTGWAHVLIYDQSNTRVKAMRVAHPQISQYVRRVFQDRDGIFWFGTDVGVCRYDGKSFVYLTKKDGLGDNQINHILQDEAGHLWFATLGGVSRYDGKVFTNYTAKDGLGDIYTWGLARDSKGNIWAGGMSEDRSSGELVVPRAGVYRYDGKSFASFPIPSAGVKEPRSRFNPKLVWAIYEDKAGHIWFGTDGDGARKYDGKTFTTYTDKEGLADNNVVSITGDKAGNIWFGTWHGGVSRYDGKSFTTFTTKDGLPNNFVSTMREDRKGNMWFGTAGGGACRYDGKTFTTFTDSLTRNFVQSIFEDKDGQLWFGCSGGVFRFDGKALVNFTRESANKPWPERGTERPFNPVVK